MRALNSAPSLERDREVSAAAAEVADAWAAPPETRDEVDAFALSVLQMFEHRSVRPPE